MTRHFLSLQGLVGEVYAFAASPYDTQREFPLGESLLPWGTIELSRRNGVQRNRCAQSLKVPFGQMLNGRIYGVIIFRGGVVLIC